MGNYLPMKDYCDISVSSLMLTLATELVTQLMFNKFPNKRMSEQLSSGEGNTQSNFSALHSLVKRIFY